MRLNGYGVIVAIMSLLVGAPPHARGERATIKDRLYRHMISMPTDSVTRRHAFTRADTLTREYIVEQFAACGLKPVSKNGGYLQPFPVIRGIRLVPGSGVVVASKGAARALKRKDEYVAYEQSGNGSFSGGVAFIGYGIRAPESGYDDFSKVDLKGKTVICCASPPTHIDMKLRKMSWRLSYMKKAALIDSLGGRAAVFVLPASYGKKSAALNDIDESGVRILDDRRGKPALIPVVRITNDALARIMDDGGIDLAAVEKELETAATSRAFVIAGVGIAMDIRLERRSADACNILGLLAGWDTTRTIVIGAHYDGPWYNDNASGVAEMLELARLCGERGAFDCNLLFAAFGLEEMGVVGSRYFVKNRPPRAGAIKAMVNFDVIGRISGDSLYVGNMQPGGEWEGLASNLDSRDFTVVSKPRVGGSDSYAFFDAGIPTFWFFEGFHGDVHTRDTLDAINWDGMERAALYAFDLVSAISDGEMMLGRPVREDSLGLKRDVVDP